MSIIEHKCKGCVFLNKINNMPKCSLNRLDHFDYTLDDDNDPVLNRFCNTSRPEAWLDDLSVDESSDVVSTVMKEVHPRVGFIIRFNEDLEALRSTVSDIKAQSIPARYVIVLNPKVEFNTEIQELLVSSFSEQETKHHIVQLLELPENESLLVDEAFRHAKNGWVYVCHSGFRIDHELLSKINHRININMKPLVVVEPVDEKENGLLFQSALFKFLNGNKLKVFSDEESVDESFLNKARMAAERSNPETFITWEAFNEA